MYKHILKERGQIFEEAVTLPRTNPHVCATALNVGNQHGMLACTLTANASVVIATGKAVTLVFQHADSEGGVYADHSTHTVALVDALHVAPGGLVARVVLPPDTKPWIRAKLSCDDGAAVGSIDVSVEYLAR